MLVTMLIPCHDEAEALPDLFRDLEETGRRLLPEIMLDLLLVDDGSFDRTLEMLEAFAERAFLPVRVVGLRPWGGIGSAIRQAAPLAAGEITVTYDADRPYPLEDLPGLVAPIREGRADVVTASPWHPQGESEDLSLARVIPSRTVSLLYRLRCGSAARGIHTYTCGFRAYRTEMLKRALPRRDGFVATAEILLRCLREGARVEEVPSTLRRRRAGRSKLKLLRTTLAHLGLLLRGP